ncbi:MAG: hypothetical protein J6N72_00610 [Psychrobacter sp.]|nr:hypothetical protein [Psychrobacter sp.]
MNSNTGYVAKTEAEIETLTIAQLTERFYEMQEFLGRQKQMLEDIFAIDSANLDVMEMAADAVIKLQKENAEQSVMDEYDVKYKHALKNVNASTDRRKVLLQEAETMAAEIKLIADTVKKIQIG